MSIPVICLEEQPDIWNYAHTALSEHELFVLVKTPFALETIISLSNKIGPAVLLTGPGFLEPVTFVKIRDVLTSGALSVLVITESDSDDQAIAAFIREGYSGALAATGTAEMCRKAIRSVAAGELWAPRKTAARIIRELSQSEPSASFRKLTPREAEILELIAGGYSNREIASHLFITRETVRWHVRALYSKLGVADRGSAKRLWQLREPGQARSRSASL